MVNKSIRLALQMLYPERCLLCGLMCDDGFGICPGCRSELPGNRHACSYCALPLDDTSLDDVCRNCQDTAPAYSRCIAPWQYRNQISVLVRQLKDRGRLDIARVLGELLAVELANFYQSETWPELVVPVPLHWWRHCRRGFNQATETAHHILSSPTLQGLEASQRPVLATRLCRRYRSSRSQRGLTATQRRDNLQDSFRAHPSCAGRRVAVVDDVITTGATAEAVAGALAEAGCAEIHLWAIARTPTPRLTIPQ